MKSIEDAAKKALDDQEAYSVAHEAAREAMNTMIASRDKLVELMKRKKVDNVDVGTIKINLKRTVTGDWLEYTSADKQEHSRPEFGGIKGHDRHTS